MIRDEVNYHNGIPMPSVIDLNITELCNRLCSFCPRAVDYPNQNLNMTALLAKEINSQLNSIDYKGRIHISGFSEPLLCPHLIKIVKILKNKNRFIYMTTNGDKLTPELIHKLYRSGVDYISVSIYDSPEQEQKFKQMLKDYPNSEVRTRIGEFETLTNRGGALNSDSLDAPCYYLSYMMQIDWNGDVTLCIQDWNKRIKFGNIFQTHIWDIWTSKSMSSKRNKLAKGKREGRPCSECNACGTTYGSSHVEGWNNVTQ